MRKFVFGFAMLLTVAQAAVGMGFFQESNVQTVNANDVSGKEKTLNLLYLHQWVSYGEDGVVRGNVVRVSDENATPVAGSMVMLVQNGSILHSAQSNNAGDFAIQGVKPGTYSLIAKGQNSIGAFALMVIAGEGGKHLPKTIDVPVVDPVGRNIRSLLESQMMPYPKLSLTSVSEDPWMMNREFSNSRYITPVNGALVGKVEQFSGSVGRDYSDMDLYLVQNDRIVEQVSPAKDGSFKFPNLAMGNYGFLAFGPDGFCAFSFIFGNSTPVAASGKEGRFVNAMVQSASLNVQIVPSGDMNTAIDNPPPNNSQDNMVADGLPGFGGGGGGGGGPMSGVGGGGGGGGGIGGGGGLLGAAGLAAGAAALGNNNGFQPVAINSRP